MNCRTAQFNVACGQITDATALHLDDCPSCRASFDTACPPILRRKRSHPSPAWVLLAAVAVAMMALRLPSPDVEPNLGECLVEAAMWTPPDCPID